MRNRDHKKSDTLNITNHDDNNLYFKQYCEDPSKFRLVNLAIKAEAHMAHLLGV